MVKLDFVSRIENISYIGFIMCLSVLPFSIALVVDKFLLGDLKLGFIRYPALIIIGILMFLAVCEGWGDVHKIIS